jgi:hypothetical protein
MFLMKKLAPKVLFAHVFLGMGHLSVVFSCWFGVDASLAAALAVDGLLARTETKVRSDAGDSLAKFLAALAKS